MAEDKPKIDPITERVCKLVRMFGATDGEANVAFAKLRNFFIQEKLSFNDLAAAIEQLAGGAYTSDDVLAAADKAKDLGEQEGYAKAKREAAGPPEFYGLGGEPDWYAIALYIDGRRDRLTGWERRFVEGDPQRGSLVVNMAKFGKPTPKQTKPCSESSSSLAASFPPKFCNAIGEAL